MDATRMISITEAEAKFYASTIYCPDPKVLQGGEGEAIYRVCTLPFCAIKWNEEYYRALKVKDKEDNTKYIVDDLVLKSIEENGSTPQYIKIIYVKNQIEKVLVINPVRT